jgi:hypothetical protein
MRQKPPRKQRTREPHEPSRVRLPGFLNEEVGLGDLMTRATRAMGFKHCAACARRASTLNRWVRFSG